MSFNYAPDEIAIHPEGTLKQLCGPFRSHENGLPEWIKNSKDAYIRENTSPDKRVIVIIFESGNGEKSASLSCLDLVGMTSEVIESRFRKWGDPEAARRNNEDDPDGAVEGGHGNGGKAYMCTMFAEYATLYTVRNNAGCVYGVPHSNYKFGYVPDKRMGRDFRVESVSSELSKALQIVGASQTDLPLEVQIAAKACVGFTLVSGFSPKDMSGLDSYLGLTEHLISHPQCMQSLQLCQVYVVADGQLLDGGRPLTLPQIKPYKGLESYEVSIPRLLEDPLTGENISTVDHFASGNQEGKLRLLSSEKSMRWKSKYRHLINFKGRTGYLGHIPVLELDVRSTYKDNIYGDCILDSLEQDKLNDRTRLAESKLSRAVIHFVAKEVQQFAEQFEDKEKRKHSAKERSELSKTNEAFNKWKNRFLKRQLSSMGANVNSTPVQPLPVGKVSRIEIGLTHSRAGIGVSLRPKLKFFDKDGNRVRQQPYRWMSEDTNVAMVLDDVNMLYTYSAGTTAVYAETLDERVRSNKAPLEVVLIDKIRLDPLELELPAGSRKSIDAICQLVDGSEVSDVCLVWTEDNTQIARVVAPGLVYGFSKGQTTVLAGDDRVISDTATQVSVLDPIRRQGNTTTGDGFPLVLISEYDPDPETGETVVLKSADAPIVQRTEDADRNIWWINSAAPFARLFLDKSKGYGYHEIEWRIYYAEKYTEVIAQILMLADDAAQRSPQSIGDWFFNWGNSIADIQSQAVLELSNYIATGTLPE